MVFDSERGGGDAGLFCAASRLIRSRACSREEDWVGVGVTFMLDGCIFDNKSGADCGIGNDPLRRFGNRGGRK